MNSREFHDRLSRRARRARLSIGGELATELETYFRLLSLWNKRINLTGLDLGDPAPETIDRLLIEPVAAARHAPPRTARVLDLGSGGGSPAIPFALALGGVRLRMVESKTRKSVFLREAVRTLALAGAEVITARFEELLARTDFDGTEDLLTVRAVRVQPSAVAAIRTFIRPGGQLFLFTGSDGRSGLPAPEPLRHVATVPLVESLGSHLTILERPRATTNVPRGTSP